ncbi:hypothetical protein [Flavobacterium sp. 7A]|uniref:hypothetical protein n=1 Tax=Flavobacterium sp. 7A TaxID=2940571 RepID=UPI002226608F|nr:hypothetical protein [Flavobacterium sp. 7A]MCW2118745.1 hypothetical protein [Flavobacterium sp. 7A]
MKTRKQIFWYLSVVLLCFVSCTSDVDDEVKYLKKIEETLDGGTTKITTFQYQGNQIVSIDNEESIQEFTYVTSEITAITTTNKLTSLKNVVNYSYDGDKLKSVESAGDYLVNYSYNTDGTVSFEKFNISIPNVETKIYHGTLYLNNKNVVKEDYVLDDVAVGVISKFSVSYEYDLKINPLHNIMGYEKLLDHKGVISSNNYLIMTEETSFENNGQIISSASFYNNSFKYDAANYPVEKNSLFNIPDKGLSINEKTVYVY